MANPLRYYSLLLRCYCTDSQTTRARGGLSIPQQTPHAFPCMCAVHPVYHLLFERSEFLIATSKKKNMCASSTNLGFSGEKICACVRQIVVLVLRQYDTRLVRIMYQIRMYLVSAGRNLYQYVRTWWYAITRTFRPWTHTSDDSYIYQLSLVVATATVSLYTTIYYVWVS